MAELTSRDRLQPSLLDRLIDPEPQSRQEPVEARVLTQKQLRAAVLRDLGWLFNATRQEPEPRSERKDELALWRAADQARRSVLNFGVPAFAGVTLSTLDSEAIESAVTESIKCFEPRIDPASLQVELKRVGANHHNLLQLIIRGRMWAQPVPLELLLAADVDVETGNTRVRELRG